MRISGGGGGGKEGRGVKVVTFDKEIGLIELGGRGRERRREGREGRKVVRGGLYERERKRGGGKRRKT